MLASVRHPFGNPANRSDNENRDYNSLWKPQNSNPAFLAHFSAPAADTRLFLALLAGMLCILWGTCCSFELSRWPGKTRRTHASWARWLWRELAHPPANLSTTRGLRHGRQLRYCVVKPPPPPTSHTLNDTHSDGSKSILRHGMRLARWIEATVTLQVGGMLEALYLTGLVWYWLATRQQPPSSDPSPWAHDGSSRAHGQALDPCSMSGQAPPPTSSDYKLEGTVMGMFLAWHIVRATAAFCWRRRAVVYWRTRLLLSALCRTCGWSCKVAAHKFKKCKRKTGAMNASVMTRRRTTPTSAARPRSRNPKRGDHHFDVAGGVSKSYLVRPVVSAEHYISREAHFASIAAATAAAAAAATAAASQPPQGQALLDDQRGQHVRRWWRVLRMTCYLVLVCCIAVCVTAQGTHSTSVSWRPSSPWAGIKIGQARLPGPGTPRDWDFDAALSLEGDHHYEMQHQEDHGEPPELESASESESEGWRDKVGTIIPRWDAGLDEHQSAGWAAAEKSLKCYKDGPKNGHGGQRKSNKKSTKNTVETLPATLNLDFHASSKFQGSRTGYHYKVGQPGLGYYKHDGQGHGGDEEQRNAREKAAAFNYELRQAASTLPPPAAPPERRTRRARNQDGTRRGNAKPQGMGGVAFPAVSTLASSWWKSHGLWAIDTTNPNSFDAGRRKVLRRSKANVVLLQEAKLKTKEEIDAAKRAARRDG